MINLKIGIYICILLTYLNKSFKLNLLLYQYVIVLLWILALMIGIKDLSKIKD